MAIERKVELEVDRRFDSKTCRHSLNGSDYVLHCHHYATLYSQLADDAELFDGKRLLRQASEMAFVPELTSAFAAQGVTALADRIAIVEEYWRLCGMGQIAFESVGAMASEVRMDHSHVDEGWKKKWGDREAPVNFIGQGFIAAALAAIFDAPAGSFVVNEYQSIVAGAECSRFRAVRA